MIICERTDLIFKFGHFEIINVLIIRVCIIFNKEKTKKKTIIALFIICCFTQMHSNELNDRKCLYHKYNIKWYKTESTYSMNYEVSSGPVLPRHSTCQTVQGFERFSSRSRLKQQS